MWRVGELKYAGVVSHELKRFTKVETHLKAQKLGSQLSPHRKRESAWQLPVHLFAACLLLHISVGLLCSWFPPGPRTSAAGQTISGNATCVRVTRHADYVTADFGVGTPSKQQSLLLRLDKVLEANASQPAMRLFSQETVESTTVSCNSAGECEDVAMVTRAPDGANRVVVARFDYRHSAVERAEGTTASRLSGVAGELALRAGNVYSLTATHLCWTNATATEETNGIVRAGRDSQGRMFARRASLASSTQMRVAPVSSARLTAQCTSSDAVLLFPVGSGAEASWLSLFDTSLYNSEPESVDVRRTISELGTACAKRTTALLKDLVLYNLDCSPYEACVDHQNLPLRRVATTSMQIRVDHGGAVGIHTQHDERLAGLPRLANSTEAFVLSLMKLLLIVLTAAIVYVRSKRPTASSSWLFKHCVMCAGSNSKIRSGVASTVEDRVVGALAFAARCAISAYRGQALNTDGQLRVVVSEIAASVLSAIHWGLRHYFMVDDEPPLTLLGGSTAIVDSCAAVMMAFAEPPTIAVSIGRFDPTARLLVAILISIVVTTRCAFSSACCGVMWMIEKNPATKRALLFGAGVWIVQTGCIAALVADLFVAPAAFSMSRTVAGSALPARVLLFLSLVCAGLPRLTRTLRHMLSAGAHVD